MSRPARVSFPWFAALASALVLAGCSGNFSIGNLMPGGTPSAPSQSSANIGTGEVKAGLILPLSGSGNAAVAAASMRNAAEMALAEFPGADVQLLVKDDGGNAQSAQTAAQQALDEGAEIILGPLFALTVGPVGQVARARNVPVIAFSTDANVAARGVYLLSFLPESDVDRIIGYAAGQGKRSFAALIPDNAYGTVVEAALKGADAILIADSAEGVATAVQTLTAAGIDTKKMQLLGTGLWEDAQIFSNPQLDGAWYAGPDSTGFRNFSGRYRTKYGQDPVRTASLAYDAVALVAALVKTQGAQRFSEEVLTGASGFAGIDGIFRFRADGTNERGLAVMKVAPAGGQVVSPAPRSFAPGT